MNRPTLIASAALALVMCALALRASPPVSRAEGVLPPRVRYTVALDQPQTQMVDITMTVDAVKGEHIDFMLPIWRPGRYVVLNLSRSIRDFRAFGENDQPLSVDKADSATWRVALNGSSTVRIEYRVYANALGDRTRHVDDTHAFLSGAAVFMYAESTRAQPCWVTIIAPAGWDITCGLDFVPGSRNTLAAPDYDTLIDSPMEIGVQQSIDFMAAGKPHRIVIWTGGEPVQVDDNRITRDFTRIVEQQTGIFGSSPYERYLFIIHAGAGASGGTEHVNSTVMQTTRAALEEPGAYQRFLNLVSHEFFHTWNIKAFRPAGLIPYAYQRPNHTDLLWVVEGTTTYYAALTLVRAGFTQPARYLETLAGSIDSMLNRHAETVQSVSEASFDSWIHWGTDNRTPDDVNFKVDFYGKGALVSLLIDLEMRRRSNGKAGLDDVMRSLYERFPLASGVGYTTDDLKNIIEEHTGADFTDVFNRYVRAAEPLDFAHALAAVGIELAFQSGSGQAAAPLGRGGRGSAAAAQQPSDDASSTGDDSTITSGQSQRTRAYIGLNLSDGSGPTAGRTTIAAILSDGPAYTSGLLVGDEIVAINSRRVTASTLDATLRAFKPGDVVTVSFFRRDTLRTVELTLAGRPDGRWTLRKVRNPTEQQRANYEAWLGQRW